jgi:hypothetical protein
MKIYLNLFALIIITTGCMSQKDYVAEFDFNYSGNFKKYKTYGFVENQDMDSLVFYQQIEKTISSRLGSQGFKLQPDRPDLLINFKVFEDEVRYRGYDQPHFDSWLQRRGVEFERSEEEERENREKDENYNRVKFTENKGLLVVYIIDNKKGNTIWQGYTATNLDFRSSDISNDLTRATYRVMDQFRILTRF